jgi:synaptotagmin-7
VKVWLQFGDKRIEKRKTPIFKCTLNPHFNDSFSFNVPWEKIRECSLDVMVMDFDNIGRNELIGRILLAGEWILIDFGPITVDSNGEWLRAHPQGT